MLTLISWYQPHLDTKLIINLLLFIFSFVSWNKWWSYLTAAIHIIECLLVAVVVKLFAINGWEWELYPAGNDNNNLISDVFIIKIDTGCIRRGGSWWSCWRNPGCYLIVPALRRQLAGESLELAVIKQVHRHITCRNMTGPPLSSATHTQHQC